MEYICYIKIFQISCTRFTKFKENTNPDVLHNSNDRAFFSTHCAVFINVKTKLTKIKMAKRLYPFRCLVDKFRKF